MQSIVITLNPGKCKQENTLNICNLTLVLRVSSLPSGVSVVLPVVPESAASDGVDYNEEYEEDDVDHSHLFPITLQIIQYACLARLAIKTLLIIRPSCTIRISGVGGCRWTPYSRVHICEVAFRWWLAATRLKWREALLDVSIEIFVGAFLSKFLADFAILQATPDLPPILAVVHSLLQPIRVVPQLVLFVPSIGHDFARAFVGDNEGEDCEAKEEHDEQEHD